MAELFARRGSLGRWGMVLVLALYIGLASILPQPVHAVLGTPQFSVTRAFFDKDPSQPGQFYYTVRVDDVRTELDYSKLAFSIALDGHSVILSGGIFGSLLGGNEYNFLSNYVDYRPGQTTYSVSGSFDYTPNKTPTSFVRFRFMSTDGNTGTVTQLKVIDVPKTNIPGVGVTPTPVPTTLHFTDAEYLYLDTATVDTRSVRIAYSLGPTTDFSGYTVKIYLEGKSDPLYNQAAQASDTTTTTVAATDNGKKVTFQLIKDSKIIDTKSVTLDSAAGTGSADGSKTGIAAETPNPCPQGGASFVFCNTLFGDRVTANDYLTKVYDWAVAIAVLGATGMIIWAGYRYAVSRGNPAEIGNAKEIIISALVGLGLLVLSFVILRFLGVTLVSP